MRGIKADVFVEVEGGHLAPVELHRNQLTVEQQRRVARRQAEHGGGFFADQSGQQARGDAGGGNGRGLNDDFHKSGAAEALFQFRANIGLKTLDVRTHEFSDVFRFVSHQRREVHAEDQLRRAIRGVGGKKGRVR